MRVADYILWLADRTLQIVGLWTEDFLIEGQHFLITFYDYGINIDKYFCNNI